MFIRDLVAESSKIAQEKKANTVTLMHLYINTIYKTLVSSLFSFFIPFFFFVDMNQSINSRNSIF